MDSLRTNVACISSTFKLLQRAIANQYYPQEEAAISDVILNHQYS